MDLKEEQILEVVPSAFESCLQKAKNNTKSFQEPSPRIFHSSVCHRAFIFIYGGLSLDPAVQFQNEHLFVYRYEIHRFEWKKIQTNFPSNLGFFNPLQNIYSHSCVVYGNVMYLFGGRSGKDGQCHNELWAMNLQSFNWRKQDQKGIIPTKRQSASLVLFNKSFLFLYGGKNEDQTFNDIHIYKIESKQWYSIETSTTEFLMPKRLRPGITVVNDMVYIFGGERQCSQNSREDLDDFYQIRIVHKNTSVKPDVWVKKLTTSIGPKKVIAPKLFSINEKYVGLIATNTEDEPTTKLRLWIHDPHKLKWIFSNVEDSNNQNLGFGFNVIFQYDRVYISGGLNNQMTPVGSLYSIHIDPNEILSNPQTPNGAQKFCLICSEQKHSLCRKKLNGFKFVEQSLNDIKYPFNAFGLLIDNCNLLKSTSINIECCQISKQKFIIISDDGSCDNIWANEDEFFQDMTKFRTISEQEMEIEDEQPNQNNLESLDQPKMDLEEDLAQKKKQPLEPRKQEPLLISMKKQEEKEEEKKLKKKKQLAKKNKARKLRKRKEFSINLKIGAMRIARKMIYLTETPEGHKRVFFLQNLSIVSLEEEDSSNGGQVIYQCHYFLIPSQSSPQINSHHSSQSSRQLIENEYRIYLKSIPQGSTFKNHMILIGLKDILTEDGAKEPELKINTKVNDIYFGSSKLIARAESLNIFLPDCIDISLKCYLSMLYLKGEYAKITISTQTQKKEEISNALYFQKIDNLVKSNNIMDLEDAFDLEECKIVELYYYKNLLQTGRKPTKTDKRQRGSLKQSQTNNLSVFLNGILIYHRNRLIKRYDFALGSLLKLNEMRKIVTKNYNPLKIFGFIELDEVFYSNIFKTNFVNQENLNNMYARIKFVEEYLENKSQQIPIQLSTKRSYKKAQIQAGEEMIETKKKVKGQ